VGFWTAGGGDVNGDGFDDILSGRDFDSEGGEEAGAVYLFHGPVSGVPTAADAVAKIVGEEPGDNAGRGVSTAGDFDGDGFDDILIGAFEHSGGATKAGAAYDYRRTKGGSGGAYLFLGCGG